MKRKKEQSQYELEAIVSFDERGQLVIPKDLRKKFRLKAGDKFALISCVQSGCDDDCSGNPNEICCFTLVNTSQLKNMLPDLIGHAVPK